MSGDLSTVAYGAVLVSVAIAIVMLIVLLLLIARRFRAEARAQARLAEERAIARALLVAISAGDENPALSPLREIADDAQIAATTHLFQLLRGTDRDRLIALAESSGVFSGAMADLQSKHAARRVDAIRMLERFGTDASVAGLTARMASDPSPVVRIEAAATLARLARLPPVSEVIAALGLEDMTLTRQHRALLREMAPRHHAELCAVLDTPVPASLRAAVVDALGWSEDFSVLPYVTSYAKDADPEIRCSALKAAGQLGHPAARHWVGEGLDDAVGEVRAEAITACDQLGLASTLPHIATMLHDPFWPARAQARRVTNRAIAHQGSAGRQG